MGLRSPTKDEIYAGYPNLSPPNALIGNPVRNSPGFPLKACKNDGTGTSNLNPTSIFAGGANDTKIFIGCAPRTGQFVAQMLRGGIHDVSAINSKLKTVKTQLDSAKPH